MVEVDAGFKTPHHPHPIHFRDVCLGRGFVGPAVPSPPQDIWQGCDCDHSICGHSCFCPEKWTEMLFPGFNPKGHGYTDSLLKASVAFWGVSGPTQLIKDKWPDDNYAVIQSFGSFLGSALDPGPVYCTGQGICPVAVQKGFKLRVAPKLYPFTGPIPVLPSHQHFLFRLLEDVLNFPQLVLQTKFKTCFKASSLNSDFEVN